MTRTDRTSLESKNEIRSDILKLTGYQSGKALLESIPWEVMSSQIASALKALLTGRKQLRLAHQSHLAKSEQKNPTQEMTFALDGRLVGDIGELIAAETFCLDLLGSRTKNIDAISYVKPQWNVQIKATFQTDCLSIKHGGDHFIGLQLSDEGKFRVIYNGPARPVMQYLKAPKARGHVGRTHAGNRLEPISLAAWVVLNQAVNARNRIPRRQFKPLAD